MYSKGSILIMVLALLIEVGTLSYIYMAVRNGTVRGAWGQKVARTNAPGHYWWTIASHVAVAAVVAILLVAIAITSSRGGRG